MVSFEIPLMVTVDDSVPRIEPILYETIIVRSNLNASRLLQTIKTKPLRFFDTNVKSLALGSSVTFLQAKDLLAKCSQYHIVNFAVWGYRCNLSSVLPFIRSPAVRRLSLQCHYPSELNIPPGVLSSLTHLIIVDGPYAWYHLRNAVYHIRHTDGSHPDHITAIALFQNLTHFGVDSQNWGSARSLLEVAKNLKYFAIFVPRVQFRPILTITQRIAELGDRRVIVMQYDYSIEDWEASVRGGVDVWDRVERLVDEGYYSEQGGTRWPRLEPRS
jgi:hypothetical protein